MTVMALPGFEDGHRTGHRLGGEGDVFGRDGQHGSAGLSPGSEDHGLEDATTARKTATTAWKTATMAQKTARKTDVLGG